METKEIKVGSYWLCMYECFVYDVYGLIKNSGSNAEDGIPWEVDVEFEEFAMNGIHFECVRASWLNNQCLIPIEQFIACFKPIDIDKNEWKRRVNKLAPGSFDDVYDEPHHSVYMTPEETLEGKDNKPNPEIIEKIKKANHIE